MRLVTQRVNKSLAAQIWTARKHMVPNAILFPN